MLFSISELKEMQALVNVYRQSQESEGMRLIAAPFHAIESRLMLAEREARAAGSNLGSPNLDSQLLRMLNQACAKSRPDLSNKIRQAIFKQSEPEAFSDF